MTARQRNPWNGLVDIVVTIQGSAEDVADSVCTFAATNSATKAAIPVVNITQNGDDAGSGTVWTRKYIWDAKADVGAVKIDDVALTVDVEIDYGGVQLWENGPYWAECNVGARKPEEYGYYFWWGDTVGYKRNANNDGWISVKDSTIFSFSIGNCPTSGKDNSRLQSAGYLDARGKLVAAHDAATAHLGAPWRMPTDWEWFALIRNCTTTWTTRNGVAGRLMTGKGAYASKSIFLPAAGFSDSNSEFSYPGSQGRYWSSASEYDRFYSAWGVFLISDNFEQNTYSRHSGLSVRPVRGSADASITAGAVTTHLEIDCTLGAVTYRAEPNYLDGGITLTGIASGTPSGTLYIPSTYNGQAVTAVGDNFYQLGGITKVVFPSTVKRIVDCGFEDCPNLQEVELNEGLEEIGGWAFNDCDKIKKIVIPSTVRSIGDSSFNINGLESIDVAGGNDWYCAENGFLIEKAARRTITCISVCNGRGVSLAVPQGVLVIGRDTFRKSKCTAVSFPSSIREIETLGVLAPDSTIREIDLSACENLTSIGAGGFMAAQQLAEVRFPESLLNIGRFAFGGCAALQEVTFLGRRVSIPEELDGELEEYLKTLASGAINPERGGDLYVTRDGKPLPNVTTYVLPGMGWENEIRAGKWQGCPLERAPGYAGCRFDGNGSPDSMPSIAMKIDHVYKLPKCTLRPPSDRLHFAGWACSNGRRYDDEMLVFDLGDVTMTAIWDGEGEQYGGVQLWEGGPYWAECNVGATKPEEPGYYFWWGDTVGYKRNANNDGWISVKDSTGFSFDRGHCPTDYKSNSQLQLEGYIDASGNLVAAHDAATAHLGAPWRMPTDEEFSALFSNCTTTWTTRNGVSGRLVMGKGAYAWKSIFLPAAGYGNDSDLYYLGSYGYYWSSSLNSDHSNVAWSLFFRSGSFRKDYYYRDNGRSVRPVRGFAK